VRYYLAFSYALKNEIQYVYRHIASGEFIRKNNCFLQTDGGLDGIRNTSVFWGFVEFLMPNEK